MSVHDMGSAVSSESLRSYDWENILVGEMLLGEFLQLSPVARFIDSVPLEDLASKRCERILTAAKELSESGALARMEAVSDRLKASGAWHDGDEEFMCDVVHRQAIAGTDYFVADALRRVLADAKSRRTLRLMQEAQARIARGEDEAQVMAELDAERVEYDSSEANEGIPLLRGALDAALAERPPTIETPWPTINRKTHGGIHPGELWVLGGVTSHGKTAAAVAIANKALSAGKRVLYVTFENRESLVLRLIGASTGARLGDFFSPNPQTREAAVAAGMGAAGVFAKFGVENGMPVARILRRVSAVKPDLLIVDFVQALALHEEMDGQEGRISWLIGRAMDTLKKAANRTGCACLILAQLNERAISARDDKTPRASDILESQSIQIFSDRTLLLNWPHRFKASHDPRDYRIIVDKNKDGQHGEVRCVFIAEGGIIQEAEAAEEPETNDATGTDLWTGS